MQFISAFLGITKVADVSRPQRMFHAICIFFEPSLGKV